MIAFKNLILAAAAAVATLPVNALVTRAAPTCVSEGPASAGELQREWILVGWEKPAGDGPFDFREKLGRFYHWHSNNVVLYDDFDPEYRVARTPQDYGAIWTAPFTALKSARHRVIDGPEAIESGNLATSTLEFAARLEAGDGQITGIRTRSTLVWQCTADGWKIVREHNSSRRIGRAEIDAIIP